MSPIDNFSETV